MLAWRDGLLAFDNESASQVVASFNRYNTRRMAIADPGIAALQLSGAFQFSDPESFILALQRIYPASQIVAEVDPHSGAIQLRRGRHRSLQSEEAAGEPRQ
jgi:ferric-dicitrate binding protein FerR (iron transport regulator)